VGLHQTRQCDASVTIQNRHAVRCRSVGNAPSQYHDIREVAPKRTNVADKQISRHRLFPIHADQMTPVRHAMHLLEPMFCPSRFSIAQTPRA
jgi:hypothetical protein